ncbi:hypothetical protein BC830DRAFT_470620 [Chytriomyces sp. MP71]|nr:hypothetical protein BC830DRAFT_470620 [Chytriomyces sp. MP71]
MDVFILDVTNNSLRFVVPEELALFVNIHTFRAGENLLPFAKLGALPNLRRLYLPFNEISDMDLEVDGLFSLLEHLDLSYNHITSAALIVLATLPSLKHLDLSANKIPTLPLHLISDMAHWRERVIELLLPNHVALLDATLQQEFGKDWAPERLSAPPTRANTVHEAMRVFAERTGSPPMSAPDVAARLSAAAAAVAAQRDAGETIMEDEDDVIVDVHLEERDLRVDTHHGLRPWGEEEDSVDRTMAKVPVPPEGLRRSDSPRRRSAGEGKDAAGGEGRGGEDNEVGMPMPLRVTGAPIAFEVLETLVLERNALFSDESFLILGRLPLLKRLNLNYNRFRSLVFLSDHQKGNDISESPPPPFLVKKYDGFPKLEELRVAFNKIDSVRGLLAVVWLPVLKFIWLEGNPVLIKFGKVASQAKETLYQKSLPDIVSYAECDPLKLLPRVYGIEILDLIYQPHPSVLEGTYYALAPVKKTGSVALRRIVRTNHHIHSQVVAPAALPESEDSLQPLPPYSTTVLVHEVEDVIQPRPEELKERRREFKLTDEEVKETVRAGRVLTLKELKRLRRREEQEARALDKRREMERRMYEEELQRERTKMEELLAMQKLQMEQQQENEQQQNQRSKGQQQEGLSQTETSVMSGIGVDIKFDPTVQDRTFLTSVHITGGSGEMTTTILSVPQLLEPKDQSNDVPDGQWPNDETEEKYTQQQQEVEETFSLLESFQESSNSFSTLDNTEDSYNPPRRISTRLYHHLNSKHILPTAARAAERRKELARNHQFPKSIQSSIRALRHALTNPISYWRVVEDSYAKPTFAHTVRVKDAAAEAAAARKAKMEAEGRYYRPETEPKDYDDFMGDPMVFEGGVNQQGLKPPMSPARSETSSAVDANLIPESGNISPANTMWTTAAVKFNAEREAAIAAANRAAKNVVATAKIAITTAVKVEVPREKGVFIEEDALELAQKLGKEQLRKRIILMNDEDENEANGSLDKSQPSQPSTQSEKSSSLAQQEKGKSELLKRLEREKLEEEDARRRLQEEGLMGGLDFKRPDSDYRFSAVQRQHMNKTPAGAATLAALRAAEYKRKLNEKKKQEAKKIKTKDEFEEMKEIMTLMDSKITTIEANLASVLKSNIMQKHVPQSRKLIDEVQAEYKRIEKMYHESAMAAIEASKLKSK